MDDDAKEVDRKKEKRQKRKRRRRKKEKKKEREERKKERKEVSEKERMDGTGDLWSQEESEQRALRRPSKCVRVHVQCAT